MKRTKIVCTIGPASREPAILRAMIRAGMDVARLNFSHGTHADHGILIRRIRAAAKAEGRPIAILQDLQGPKIRLGGLPPEGVELLAGQSLVLRTGSSAFVSGQVPILPVTYASLHKDVAPGHRILVDDGLLAFRVRKVAERAIHAEIVNGGVVTSHKGMNFPDSTLPISSLTPKDLQDVAFGIRQEMDWIALSFVTSAREVKRLRAVVSKVLSPGQLPPNIISKIEKHEAIRSFEAILGASDGIMVARGDLGIEIPAEEVPIRQKEIVEACRQAGKPVVVATQMLDSMIRNPRPTRAEVSDVANAVIDHADAVMLSGESATGAYPLEAVQMMARIIGETEASRYDDLGRRERASGLGIEAAFSHALRDLAAQGHVHGVLSATFLAPWSARLQVLRPEVPLFLGAETPSEVKQLNLRWGIHPFLARKDAPEVFFRKAVTQLRRQGLVTPGTCLALLSGGPPHGGIRFVKV
ncbi:pyruvate kinase [Candidatus Uhrbacteria bacterium]|nr:pyruvate kinase [Candidatus Uhrbacteria bacterium]